MGIKSIKHKGLRQLFETGKSARIDKRLQANALMILDHLAAIADIKDCVGVKDFHELKGNRRGIFSMHISGNWCITFKWDGQDIFDANLEDYH